jgi:hypothetical protein
MVYLYFPGASLGWWGLKRDLIEVFLACLAAGL